jgi:hypothetical protein
MSGSSGTTHHTTRAHAAYEPGHDGVRRGWILIVAGLVLTAIAALLLRPTCRPDVAGARESGFGVRHERRGTQWYHCEPWIRRALED